MIDKNAIVRYIDQHAAPHSLGKCAKYCREAFEAGGVNTVGHPVNASAYGPLLLRNNATILAATNYTPMKADVVVFAASSLHPAGHIAIFDGTQWVSDFKQLHMSPYRTAAPAATLYRFPG